MENVELIVSDHHGVYIPQKFVENYDVTQWGLETFDPDVVCVEKGPDDNEWYWESWEAILNKASCVQNGKQYYLHQDGDLFAVAWEELNEEEREDMGIYND